VAVFWRKGHFVLQFRVHSETEDTLNRKEQIGSNTTLKTHYAGEQYDLLAGGSFAQRAGDANAARE
jgi:hypothetical protein